MRAVSSFEVGVRTTSPGDQHEAHVSRRTTKIALLRRLRTVPADRSVCGLGVVR